MADEKLEFNIVVIDDNEESVSKLKSDLNNRKSWDTIDPINTGNSRIQLSPRIKFVTPKLKQGASGPSRPDETLDSYLARVRASIFGDSPEGGDQASEHYIPATVFLVDWKFDSFNWDPSGGEKPDGIALIKEIKARIPHSFCILITQHDDVEAGEANHAIIDDSIPKDAFRRATGFNKVATAIRKNYAAHLKSPTWDALRAYMESDADSFHAMAIRGGANTSSTTAGFLDKLGPAIIKAQASLTLAPLDSLLAPRADGCIAQSQDLFAEAFGARRARFGTNGTSGANSILWAALFDLDDIVLVDRNCHISHHYSAARQHAMPVYLDPQVEVSPDVFGPPSLEEIHGKIDRLADAGLGHRLKGVVLTNCTFDGLLLNARDYIESIDAKLRETAGDTVADGFVYHFDEAWFSFARFSPRLIQTTAMYAAEHARLGKDGVRPRVYATQSVHKTLSALRQASVILEHDEWDDGSGTCGLDRPRFKQSYLAHTTTSPNLPIIASFDIARRQMCIDGAEMIQQAADSAQAFANALEDDNWVNIREVFSITPRQTSGDRVKGTFPKDPTKLTLYHTLKAQSGAAKALLWDEAEIQINKFGADSAMFMFMPGQDQSRHANVLRKLSALAKSSERRDPDAAPPTGEDVIALDRCIDQNGQICAYPVDVAKAGHIAMGETLFGPLADGARLLGPDELGDDTDYLCCSFITPYPPGFPVLVPGQVVKGAALRTVLASDDEVHGVDASKRVLVRQL